MTNSKSGDSQHQKLTGILVALLMISVIVVAFFRQMPITSNPGKTKPEQPADIATHQKRPLAAGDSRAADSSKPGPKNTVSESAPAESSPSEPNPAEPNPAEPTPTEMLVLEDEPSLDIEPSPPDLPASINESRLSEAAMSAEELLETAQTNLVAGHYHDAFRQATASSIRAPTPTAHLIRGQAACGLRDRSQARDAMKALKFSDPERKAIRETCKSMGVRVGL